MAPPRELSSNWKTLQAKLKAESASTSKEQPSSITTGNKRKHPTVTSQEPIPKRHKPTAQPTRPVGSRLSTSKEPQPASSLHTGSVKTMGVTQSSAIVKGTPATITPSLSLWAEDNDISPEDLAEAYSLGPKPPFFQRNPPVAKIKQEKNRVNEGLAPGIEVGKYIAIDCEMVGVGDEGREDHLARVSCVDFHGAQVYDSFVQPREYVTDHRTAITGLTASMLRGPKARPFVEVQATIADLLKGRILVGHALNNDLAVLILSHPTPKIRDTARHSSFRKYGHGPKPALRVLAREILGIEDFQIGAHSSVEDARVAMLLFRAKKSEFDVENASKYGIPGEEKSLGSKTRKHQGKKRGKR
ncbi:ribonuclease H-like domain-containing protein [Xylariaceae sp. FL1272]|nr:ribonuclease H-like domain-containing protein [Xylariaceae sp. FL1272]